MNPGDTRAARLKAALDEVLSNRAHFSDDVYSELILTLHEQIERLDSRSGAGPRETDTDEIRLVTVMFVDVENSTRMAQNLDEDWKTLIGDIHRRIAGVVDEWGGEVGQYLGDGVLCFFGAHRSRDDDAVRAVSCGLGAGLRALRAGTL
jgi:class 3 adenylate cyclase